MLGYQRTNPFSSHGGIQPCDTEFQQLIRARTQNTGPPERYRYDDPEKFWFDNVYQQLGAELWEQLESVSVFKASEDDGRLISHAFRGVLDEEKLRKRFDGAKKVDQLYVISLIPLKPEPDRDADLKWRVKFLLDYAVQALGRKRDSDRLKCEEAVEKELAKLGAQVDMTPHELRMLASNSVAEKLETLGHIVRGDVICKLHQSESGEPTLEYLQGPAKLRSLPADLASDEQIVAQQQLFEELQASFTSKEI